MLNQVGAVTAVAGFAFVRPVNAAVVSGEQDAGRTGHEGERVLVDVHTVI